jgi:AraC-like DNA-binding protein
METAYLLGFEDPNSFGRAFRTWEDIPPSDWSETHRSSTVMQVEAFAQQIRSLARARSKSQLRRLTEDRE